MVTTVRTPEGDRVEPWLAWERSRNRRIPLAGIAREDTVMDTPIDQVDAKIELSAEAAEILIQIAEEFVDRWPAVNQNMVHDAIGDVRKRLAAKGVELG